MKKLHFTLLACLFISFYSKAQLALAKEDGTPINNGQIITYSTTNEDPANLHYKIKNTSANPISVRIKVINTINTDGSSFQFCYLNVCLPFISQNAVYPANTKPAINIAGNSETSGGYTMWNSDTGSGTFPIDYVLKYYMVDDLNNEYGTPITFTYRYNPSVLATKEIDHNRAAFADIPATVVKNTVDIVSTENISYHIHNLEGRTLSNGNLKKGKNGLDISALTPGIYLITLQNTQGKINSKKIVKNN